MMKKSTYYSKYSSPQDVPFIIWPITSTIPLFFHVSPQQAENQKNGSKSCSVGNDLRGHCDLHCMNSEINA